MKYKNFRLGEICSMVKGIYPTLDTEPGEYPLVVTAENRRSAHTYQLEGPAVCVPLISSTGHGDATLHRVHYQEGTFALANLLVALLPRDPKLCNTKYLYYLLMTKKNEYFVPLMSGTANVSLKIKDIADVNILLPPLEEQLQTVAWLQNAESKIEEARKLQFEMVKETEALINSLIAEISKDVLVMTSLKDLLTPVNRPENVEIDKIYHVLGAHWYTEGLYIKDVKLGSEIQAGKVYRVEEGDFVYNRLFAWKGAFAIASEKSQDCYVSNEFPCFRIKSEKVLPLYLLKYFSRPSLWDEALDLSSGGTPTSRNRLKEEKLFELQIPLPTLDEQNYIVDLASKIDEITAVKRHMIIEVDALLPSILNKAFGEMQ